MTVSVIMTCHNEERFIGAAIESVLDQTAFHRIREVIVVNDGSTDSSAEVLAGFERREHKVTVLAANGVGLPAARNLAIRRAGGAYLAILDGDDLWAADKLERQLALFDAGCDAGLAYSDYADFSAPDFSDAFHVRVRRFHAGQKDTLRAYFLHDAPIVPSTVLLRRALVADVGPFNEDCRIGEDTEFFLRAAERWTFQHVPGTLVYKRRHGGNITRRLEALLPAAEQLTRDWAARRPELAALAPKRMARCYAKTGHDCVVNGDRRRGLALLWRALRGNPLYWRVYVYLLLAALPREVEHVTRRGAKILFHWGFR